ncbi:MAG TPA: HAD-IIIC family phosphatase [Mycobacteriales bacterium]
MSDRAPGRPPIKLVVWDLDGTVWPQVALESTPVADPAVLGVLDTLAARGILLSVASHNPASVGDVLEADPALKGRFLSPQFGWGRKADALVRIAEDLDVGLDTVAFVDDDPFERAGVERSLPAVTVLAPHEIAAALSWPDFSPGPVTDAARSRVDSYRRRAARREARSGFSGTDEDFLRWCALRAVLRPAGGADSDRLVELARRTTQFNSTGAPYARPAVVLELADRFGDDGLVGVAALSGVDGPEWTVPLVAVSCRAGGRGALPLLLTGAARAARAAGAARLLVPCRLTERNVPVRLGLKEAGFTAVAREGDVATYARDLGDAPAYPAWVEVEDRIAP